MLLHTLLKSHLAVVCASLASAQRGRRLRGGRQQLDTGYGAPAEQAPENLYGAPSEEVIDVRSEELPSYAEEEPLDNYNDLNAEASNAEGRTAEDMLMDAIPGIPGEDYPIYSEAPETDFSCEGQVNGGKYKTKVYFWRIYLGILARGRVSFFCHTLKS